MADRKLSDKQYYERHRGECKQRTKQYTQKHKEHYIALKRQQYIEKKETEGDYWIERYQNRKEYHRQYNKANRNRINQYTLDEKRNHPELRILHNLRSRIRRALKGASKSKSTMALLGCSLEDFKSRLEKQFIEGMTWDNYGEWHIDHKIPCSKFNFAEENEQKKCFHYSNLQPLWRTDNLQKHAKL